MTLRNLIDLPIPHVMAIVLLGALCTAALLTLPTSMATAEEIYLSTETESAGPDIEIVIGEDKTIYEYRTNGVLIAIKVVPKTGRPYYMVPADGSPHFESLDHAKALYPQWVLFEW